MRSFITPSLILAGIALAHSQGEPFSRRKTLSFGPANPTHFDTHSEWYHMQFAPNEPQDPFSVARRFADALIGHPGELILRQDSYVDKATGVSHVYFRQVINGLEVADGNLNVNVFNGQVLSYGRSLYIGPVPSASFSHSSASFPHQEHCTTLYNEAGARKQQLLSQADQVVLDEPIHLEAVELIEHLYESNCGALPHLSKLQQSNLAENDLTDPRRAALAFMIAATPHAAVASDITNNFDQYLDKIQLTPTHNFVGSHGFPMVLLDEVPDTVDTVKAKPAYVQVPNYEFGTELVLVWKLEVEMKDNWYEAAVSATDPTNIISVVDWASDSPYRPAPKPEEPVVATYAVHAWGINDPSEANRTFEKESFDRLASPIGWHSIPVGNDPHSRNRRYKDPKTLLNFTTTFGNNVFAHEDWEGRNNWLDNYRPDAGEELVFNYTYAPRMTNNSADAMEEAKKYINATVTQLFYTSNMVHDLFYRYGFDEVSGNFQQHNFGRGGEENDAVIANAQDGSGFNNANFMTPPDGQNGRCRMYLWNTATPYRDGDMEAGIVIHELAHGLSTRLTGGPKDSSCLAWGESGGMGEGWGDFLATTIRSNSNYSDYAMGAWAANRVSGIRNYVYSLNATINPSTYKTLDKPGYWGVHAIGEVWAEILWVTSQKLIAKHGFSDTLFPPAPLEDGTVPEGDFYRPRSDSASSGKPTPLVPKHGNSLMVQLVLNGMKLQPCRPSFFDARDAIIQADMVLTNGENYCTLWEGFAERGLGPDARVEGRTPWGGGIRTNDFILPKRCRTEDPDDDPEDDLPGKMDSWVIIETW